MPRKARERSATGCYHIMARGINHTAIYNDDADNMNFLHILDFCADEDFTIFAYCLMGNHFHLLAKADADVSIATRLLPESCRKCRTTLGAVILITLAAEKRYFVR